MPCLFCKKPETGLCNVCREHVKKICLCKTCGRRVANLGYDMCSGCKHGKKVDDLFEVLKGPKRETILKQFQQSWMKGDCPVVKEIYKIHNPIKHKLFGGYVSMKDIDNVCRRWHGTRIKCDFKGKPCGNMDCALCNISTVGFKLNFTGTGPLSKSFKRFGDGIYTARNSSKSSDYATEKIMFLCKVAIGNPFTTMENQVHLKSPPKGCDSVVGVPGKDLNYEETVVYHEDAVLPAYVVLW